jgi:hypothetical protein
LQTGCYFWDGNKWQQLNANSDSVAKITNLHRETNTNLHSAIGDAAGLFGTNTGTSIFIDGPTIYEGVNSQVLRVKRAGR